jgi:hypothetical protein
VQAGEGQADRLQATAVHRLDLGRATINLARQAEEAGEERTIQCRALRGEIQRALRAIESLPRPV